MTVSIKHLLLNGYQTLKEAGIDSFQLDCKILIEHITGLSRETIVIYPEYVVEKTEAENFYRLLSRRAKREPISHIIEQREFFGYNFKVTKDTLDPRPDSEILVTTALNLVIDKSAALKILDFGTGTGCLLLAILKNLPNAEGLGIDISSSAINIARYNAECLGLGKRAEFLINYWGENMLDQHYDLIISNPPYIENAAISSLAPEVALYEPHTALFGGEDGLDCYKILSKYIANLLTKNGHAVIECGQGQEKKITTIFSQVNLKAINYLADLSGIIRCVTFIKN